MHLYVERWFVSSDVYAFSDEHGAVIAGCVDDLCVLSESYVAAFVGV